MAKQESRDHPSTVSIANVFEEGGEKVEPMEKLHSYLEVASQSLKDVLQLRAPDFNNEQCGYLIEKLKEVIPCANTFLEVLCGKFHISGLSMDLSGSLEILKFLSTMAIQIQNFVQGCCCCESKWIEAGMTLTNVSAFVSALGFDLELLRVAFCEQCASTSLTWNEVDDIHRREVQNVEEKSSADVDALFHKLLSEVPSWGNENKEKKDLAFYLLQRLKRVSSITASELLGCPLMEADGGGFLAKLFTRLRIYKRLGPDGSDTTVEEATWLGTPVAVKTINRASDEAFMKELGIIRGLSHPNITSMFCSAGNSRRCSIVMELMEGDLFDLLERRLVANKNSPPFSISEAVSIMLQIGEGVNYLHNRRIIHRDLKSKNILVKSVKKGEVDTGYVQVKVADFGISQIKNSTTRLSALTVNTGTTGWMAPEIISSPGIQESNPRNVTTRKYPFKIDTYSFAMVCYELLTGHIPFQGMRPEAVKRTVLARGRPTLPRHCPPVLTELIEGCWNQEPLKRPPFSTICKKLRHIKCLLTTNPPLTFGKPLQVEMNDMLMDANNKPWQSSILSVLPSQDSTIVNPMFTVEAEDSLQKRFKLGKAKDPENLFDSNNTFTPEPQVFLSYSGAQISFVRQLIVDMERIGIRFPFHRLRDESLPEGLSFGTIVQDGIRQCELGIVILSEEFIKSKWPMLELSAMLEETKRPDSHFRIIPVYLTISRSNIKEEDSRKRWEKAWEDLARHDERINVKKWMEALDVFAMVTGLDFANYGREEVAFRREIVNNVFHLVTPRYRPPNASYVQGRALLCKALWEKIYSQDCSEVCVIGLYGMEGIGKTTMCNVVCDDLFEDFLGRVCYAESGTGNEVEVLRHVLSRLTNISVRLLSQSNLDQYYDRLQRYVHRARVLLVLDNVSDSWEEVEQARRFLQAEYAPGSVVIVASRSLGILQSLNIDERNCLEMPKLEETEARSLFLYHAAPDPDHEVDEELLQRCMRSVKRGFLGIVDGISYHYHPVALTQFGVQLGYRPEKWDKRSRSWELNRYHIVNDLRYKTFDMLTLDSRPSFLRRSFRMLGFEELLFFMDAALFYPESPEDGSTLKQLNIFKWLSFVHGIPVDEVKLWLEGLKEKLLLDHVGDGSARIGMHPMVREFCESEANVGELACRHWVYNDSEILEEHVGPEHNSLGNRRRICLRGSDSRKKINLEYCTNVTVLKLVGCHFENHVLDLSALTSVKTLEILSCTSYMSQNSPVEILGLGLLTNLVVLRWDSIPSMSPSIEEIGMLTELRILELDSSSNENKLPDVGRLRLLREAAFRFSDGTVTITGLSCELSSLQVLDLGGCHRLLTCPGISDIVALQQLDLSDCLQLEELPALQNLTNLEKMDISECGLIRALPGLDGLVALVELDTCNCVLLKELPCDLGRLVQLRKLKMSGCSSIRALLGVGKLVALEELDLQGCSRLETLPNLGNLGRLRKLDISDCCLIDAVPGLNNLISLQELQAERCSSLVELPDLRRLTNLLVLNLTLER